MIYTGRALVVDGGVVYRDNPVTALALDPGGRYLYAATLGKIHVIDLDPNSPDYLKIISNDPTRTIAVSIPAANGGRSEERRVGKGGARTCRNRWSPGH